MGKITLYHNTSNANAISISKEGIKGGMRLDAYGKGSEAEGAGIWCTTERGYGYGGATITFQIDTDEPELRQQNDTEYIVYRDIKPEEILDIDLMISDIPCNRNRKDRINSTVESDIPSAIEYWGKEDVLKVFGKNPSHFAQPYNIEQLQHLIETGEKYCKGSIKLTEAKVQGIPAKYQSMVTDFYKGGDGYWVIDLAEGIDDGAGNNYIWEKTKKDALYMLEVVYQAHKDKLEENKHKLEEASRNELLAKAKAETITRYNKSAGYKGFSLVDIDTTAIKTRDSIVITNRVGNYFDTIELEDILYWVGLEVDETPDKKMSLETVRRALLGAMDGMDIKVDCNCGDFVYRFAYMATVLEYKYGKPENRPSNITNPNAYGALCKHLISLLSNKSWVKQVASTLQQWIIDEIDWVRKYLNVKEEDFKLPDEYARQLGRHGAMKKFWDKQPDTDNKDNTENEDTENDNVDNNEPDNKDDGADSSEVAPETNNSEETTNNTPDEKSTLNNQTNMPKTFRGNSDEELEEK